MTISLRLKEDFRLVHEPLSLPAAGTTLFEEEEGVAVKLRERLSHSSGGSFLITGFRGVGKTTAVKQALGQLEGSQRGRVIQVTVPVTRRLSSSALLFEVIRRLVERLSETGLLNSLSPQVRDPLLTAYARTSIAYRQTSTKSEERSHGAGIGGQVSMGKPKLSVPLPRLSRTRTRAESLATELSFLAYSDGDAEHDFLRILELLGRDDAVRRGRWARLLSRVGIGSSTQPFDGQVAIVFDEIDKLTETDGGLAVFQEMLGGLKNLLAASGVHFVVVAGVDLHDEWLRESATANSLYRSVFAWQGYVRCSWSAARLLVSEAVCNGRDEDREALANYLAFRGRGIIRNVLYELNELIEWDQRGPYIEVSDTAEDRVRLLGELSAVLEGMFKDAEGSVLAAPSDNDRLRQASYFTVDWVLRAGRDAFTVGDVLDPNRGTPVEAVLRPSERIVHEVLSTLAEAGYLEVSALDTEVATQGPEAERHREQYSLSRRLLDRLALIASSSPRARAEFGGGGGEVDSPLETGSDARKSIQEMLGKRYGILERIGQGGFGTVWKGVDRATGEYVAVKVIRTPTPEARRRAKFESKILHRARTDGVVRIKDVIVDENRVVIVTELIEGINLADALSQSGEITASTAVKIAIEIAQTVDSLSERAIIHADIKPSNIIVNRSGRSILVDLGTAQLAGDGQPPDLQAAETRSEQDTPSRGWTLIGTPAYMAPELFRGTNPSPQSDVWALGVLLLQLLTGRIPPVGERAVATLGAEIESLDTSSELKEALRQALDEQPANRPSAATFSGLLQRTPEALDTIEVSPARKRDGRQP